MKLRVSLTEFVHITFVCAAVYSSPLSSSTHQPSLFTSHNLDTDISKCQLVETEVCARLYTSTHLPNQFGHKSSTVAGQKVQDILSKFSAGNSNPILLFVCTLFLPPCTDNSTSHIFRTAPLLCRQLCEQTVQEWQYSHINGEQPWPFVNCQTLPTENCISSKGADSIALIETPMPTTSTATPFGNVVSNAPLEVELDHEDGYEVEVVSLSSGGIPERRYDIANLGDPSLFQGWTDVQGTGAANDYCRVVGKGKRRFLSCNLAGSTGQGHHYVSKMGFAIGHPNTWFMRDMDADGRDDYCRCVGSTNSSKVTCMKAGENGFYGSTTQGGEQHTFTLPNSQGCFNQKFNPIFGEKVP